MSTPNDAVKTINSSSNEDQESQEQQEEPIIQWLQSLELGYVPQEGRLPAPTFPVCFACGKKSSPTTTKANSKTCSDSNKANNSNNDNGDKLFKCSRCQVVSYCSKECQVRDWKKKKSSNSEGNDNSNSNAIVEGGQHKFLCKYYKRVGIDMQIKERKEQNEAKVDIYNRIRFYVCSYAVHKFQELGKGFIFLQSNCTLAELSIPTTSSSTKGPPKTSLGHVIQSYPRMCFIHYLTLGEYDSELIKDDFELAQVRSSLSKAIEGQAKQSNQQLESAPSSSSSSCPYDPYKQLVILMRFRCGHLSLGIAKLIPDYNICKSLGNDYFKNSTAGALQLNLDDV